MAIVVECVGGAGVGKSCVAEALVAELRARSIPASLAMAPVGPRTTRARRVSRKSSLALAEAIRSPGPSLRMARAVAASRQQRGRDALAIALNWLTLRALVRRCRPAPGLHVFDQAALMNLWSTGLRGDAGACRAVLEHPDWSWVLPDAVVRVEASHELNLVQLRNRGERQSRLEALADAELRSALERATADVASLVGWWGDARADAGSRPAVHITNPGDARLAEAMPVVATQLLALRSSHTERRGQKIANAPVSSRTPGGDRRSPPLPVWVPRKDR